MKKYYGAETEKAIKNFPFRQNNGKQFRVYKYHHEFIHALIIIKKATAAANVTAGNFSKDIGGAIVAACDRLAKIDGSELKEQFPLPALMGGAGTSIHMNANEVIANMATEILAKKGKKIQIHPNDHVNRGQSTNDVNPSAIKVGVIPLLKTLEETVDELEEAFRKKAREFKGVMKLGRTHLQDAVPVTLGAEFEAYADLMPYHKKAIERAVKIALTLNLGGTAVGNSVNASPAYRKAAYRELKKITGYAFKPAKNLMSRTGSSSDVLMISQTLTALTLDCSKIATDLRLMSSGPRGGFGEIALAELQKGSSIMPGKVNPIMPEMVNQLYYLVSGNNLTIEHAVHGANLELSVMVPAIIDRMFHSLKITNDILSVFTEKCVATIAANRERCKEILEQSTAYATLLTPKLGYETMSGVVKETVASGKTLREVIVAKGLLTNKEFDKVVTSFKL